MGNEQLIDEIVDLPAIKKQSGELNNELDGNIVKFTAATKAANLYNDTMLGAKTFSDYTTKAQKAAIATAEVTAAQNKAAITATQLQKTQAQLQAGLDRQALAAQKASSEFVKLTKAHKDSLLVAQNAGVVFGTQSQQYKDAADAANAYGKQLTEINKPLNVLQNNADRYANGVVDGAKKIFSYIRFAANVLPNFGIGTAFLLLFEVIKTVVSQIDIFREAMNLLNPVLTEAKVRLQAFKEAVGGAEYKTALTNLAELKENVKLVGEGLLDQDQVVNQYNATIGKLTGSVDNFNDVESALVKNGQAVIAITLKKAQAQALANSIAKNTSETVEKNAELEAKIDYARSDNKLKVIGGVSIPFRLESDRKKFIDKFEKEIDDNNKRLDLLNTRTFAAFDKVTREQLKMSAKVGITGEGAGGSSESQAIQKQRADASNSILEAEKIRAQKIIDNDKKSFDERIKATRDFKNAEIQILSNNNQVEARQTGLSPQQKQTIEQNYQNAIESIETTVAKNIQGLRNQQLDAIKTFYEKKLKLAKEKEKETTDNETAEYDNRIEAVTNYEKKANEIVKESAKVQLSKAGQDKDKRAAIYEDEAAQLKQIKVDSENELRKIEKQRSSEVAKDISDLQSANKTKAETDIQDLQRTVETANNIQKDYRNKEADEIDKQYREGRISKQQQNDALLRLDDAHNVARLARLLATEQAALKILQDNEDRDVAQAIGFGASPEQIADIKNKSGVSQQKTRVATASGQLKDAQGKQTTDDNAPAERERIARLKTAATIISAVSELTQDASRLAQAGYQNEIDLLEKKKQAIQDTADREIQAVNNSIASEKTKQNQINVIQAKAAANQRKIDSEIRKEKRKAAVSEKEFNIISAVEKTALAVVNTLASLPAPGNFVAAALVGALGAAEIATIIAQPIPKFADGVTNFRGGIARYGEAGTEIVHEPGKAPYLTTGDTIGFLPRGTDVYSHAELLQMARPASVYARDREQIGWKEVVAAINEQKQPAQKRPVVNVHLGGSGYGLRR